MHDREPASRGLHVRIATQSWLGSRLALGVFAAGLALSVVGFYQVAGSYEDFLLPQQGVSALPPLELVFYAYYALFGGLALFCAYRLAVALRLEQRANALLAKAYEQPGGLVFALALISFAASLGFRRLVLEGQPIADDEATYLFIARTLLMGRLVNPVPLDAEFFRNQFVVLNEHGWYGKYPIGHPLWLSLGELLHVRDLIMPLTAACCVALCYAIGRRVFTPRRALLGCALLVASPHFVWTAGTLLSQPTGCLMLMLGVWLALRAHENETRQLRFALLAGLAFGFGILVRPLPGVLFAAVALLLAIARLRKLERSQRLRAWLSTLLLFALTALGGCAVLLVNYLQTGDAWSSGYHQTHGGVVNVFDNSHGDLANSLFGALLRENFWLLGAPFGLLLVPFARPARQAALFWGMIAAELAYRLISPKTVVATTGPIYLTEIVPLLALAAADGLARLRGVFSLGELRGELQAVPLMAAGAVVAGCFFWPVEIGTIRRSANERSLVFRALEQSHAERALVFSDALVFPKSGVSWAYFPDNPSPDLSDDIVFVRVPQVNAQQSVQEFWQRRFPDRRAFLYMWSAQGEPMFRELTAGQ